MFFETPEAMCVKRRPLLNKKPYRVRIVTTMMMLMIRIDDDDDEDGV
jgi:hypothetical protein